MNPFLTIWYKPRKTFLHIMKGEHPFVAEIVFAVCSGVNLALELAINFDGIPGVDPSLTAYFSTVMGAVGGVLIWYFSSFVLFAFGRILGGKGSLKNVRRAYAWANIPSILGFVYWIYLFAAYGTRIFDAAYFATQEPGILMAAVPLTLLNLYTFFLLVRTQGAALNLGLFKSVVSIVIPLILAAGISVLLV